MPKSSLADFGTTPREPPRQVGRYRLVRELGRGGMGVVYEAEDPDLGRPVAIKFMSLGPLFEEHRSRFLLESRVAARLRHPHIVTVHEVGTAELDGLPVPYLCMELVRGHTLEDLFQTGGFEIHPVVSMLERIARAVHYAHEEGVLHRDLKPSNILIDSAGTPFLTDFGLAKPMGNATQLTLSGVVLGTPDYMSPEQAAGRTKDLGPWTDVWALGIILYQAATGRLPFRRDNMLGTLAMVQESDPTPPREVNPALPADLERVILKALQKPHSRRYPAARDLASDLKRWLAGEKIELDPASPVGTERHRARSVRDLWESLAHSLLLKGDYVGAEEAFEAERDATERQGAASPATEARQLRHLATVAARVGRIDVAIRRCDEGIAKTGEADPAGAAWLEGVAGLACCYAGRYADAADRVRRGRLRLAGSAGGSAADRAGAEAMICRAEGNALMGQGLPLKAVESFEAGLRLCRQCGDRVEESTALFNVADAYAHAGDPRRALAGFEETLLAKAALGDRWGLSGTHGGIARLHFEWGDLQRALDLASRGVNLAEQTEDRRMISTNRLLLGRIRLARNELPEARKECEAALDHAAAIGATPEVIQCLLGLSAVDRREGQMARAGERAARARALAEACSAPELVGDAHMAAGDVRVAAGDFEGAGAEYSLALQIGGRAANPRRRLEILASLGHAHLGRGDAGRAFTAYQGLRREAAAAGDRRHAAIGALGQAEVHLLRGNRKEALALAETAREEFKSLSDTKHMAQAYDLLVRLCIQTTEYDRAHTLVQEVIALCEAQGELGVRGLGRAHLGLARLCYETREYGRMVQATRTALELLRRCHDRTGVAEALRGTALELTRERPADALRLLREVLEDFQSAGDLGGQARVWGDIGEMHRRLGELEEARGAFLEEERVLRLFTFERGLAINHFHRASIACLRGEFKAARASAEANIALSEKVGNVGLVLGLELRGRIQTELGLFAEARSDLDRALELARWSRQWELLANVHRTLAEHFLVLGEAAAAQEEVARGRDAAGRVPEGTVKEYGHLVGERLQVLAARIALATGDAAAAAQALAGAQAAFTRLKTPILDAEARSVACQALAERGKIDQAVELLKALAELAHGIGLAPVEADALLLLGRLTRDAAAARAALALAEKLETPLRRARAARLLADLSDGKTDDATAQALTAQLLERVPPESVEAAKAAWGRGLLPI